MYRSGMITSDGDAIGDPAGEERPVDGGRGHSAGRGLEVGIVHAAHLGPVAAHFGVSGDGQKVALSHLLLRLLQIRHKGLVGSHRGRILRETHMGLAKRVWTQSIALSTARGD